MHLGLLAIQGVGEEVPLLEAVEEDKPHLAQQTLSEPQARSQEVIPGTLMTEVRLVLRKNKERRMLKAIAVEAQPQVKPLERGKPKLTERIRLPTKRSKVR